jgi:hypothetical protein
MVERRIMAVDSMNEQQPKSALMGYQLMADDDGLFEQKEAVVISHLVALKLYSTFIRDLWQ